MRQYIEKKTEQKRKKPFMIRFLIWLSCIIGGLIVVSGAVYLSQCGRGGVYTNADGTYRKIEKTQSFAFVMNNPAFAGFQGFILPWVDEGFVADITKPLALGKLLPRIGAGWNADACVDGLNSIIDRVNAGETLLYSFYSDEEKAADPSKEATGLLFLRGKAGSPLAIICPGGAFNAVVAIQEGYPIAQKLNEAGYNAMIILYRVGAHPEDAVYPNAGMSIEKTTRAGEDLGAAVRYIQENSASLGVTLENYTVWGFSAGGRMTGNFLSAVDTEIGYQQFGVPAPCGGVMVYPGIPKSYSADDVPKFVVACADDTVVGTANIDALVNEMQATGAEVVYERYETGGHGFGLGVGTNAEGWMELAIQFWQTHIN